MRSRSLLHVFCARITLGPTIPSDRTSPPARSTRELAVSTYQLQFIWSAQYNTWFTGQLFEHAGRLDDTRRKRDHGAHIFNHQTHHRSRATTLFSQNQIDSGFTDFILTAMMPMPQFD